MKNYKLLADKYRKEIQKELRRDRRLRESRRTVRDRVIYRVLHSGYYQINFSEITIHESKGEKYNNRLRELIYNRNIYNGYIYSSDHSIIGYGLPIRSIKTIEKWRKIAGKAIAKLGYPSNVVREVLKCMQWEGNASFGRIKFLAKDGYYGDDLYLNYIPELHWEKLDKYIKLREAVNHSVRSAL